jgi:hypothetical protein
MKPLRSALPPILIAVACASLTACANTPPKRTDMDYRSRPPTAAKPVPSGTASSGQNLTIQTGEGERLNLPWFIRDTQTWINNQ